MKKVVMNTDGACSGNPGPGGWGAILMYKEKKLELSGYEAHTTNNRMELLAPIQALSRLKEPCEVKVYSDSAYLVRGFNEGWLANWLKNGWRNSKKEPVENQELWQALYEMSQKHEIEWIKVKGHAGNPENERCDKLATTAIKENTDI